MQTTSLRILFVEDHVDTAEVFSRALALMGHTVTVAGDCASALELAGHSTFDLLLCDIALPDGDGCPLLNQLRRNPWLANMCAIAFSALGGPEDIRRIKQAGYNAHVLKPVAIGELVRVIEQTCGGGDEKGVFLSTSPVPARSV